MEAKRRLNLRLQVLVAAVLGIAVLAWPVTATGHGHSSTPHAHNADKTHNSDASMTAHGQRAQASRQPQITSALKRRILATPTVARMPGMPATGELVALRTRTS